MSCERFAKLVGPLPDVIRTNAIEKALNEAPGLTDLSREQKRVVSERFVRVAYRAGSQVYVQGEPEENFYILLHGKVRLTVSDNLTGKLISNAVLQRRQVAFATSESAEVRLVLSVLTDGSVGARLLAEAKQPSVLGESVMRRLESNGQTFGGNVNNGTAHRAYADGAIATTRMELLAIRCSELSELLANMPPSAAALQQQERQRRRSEHRRVQALTLHRSDLEETALLSMNPTSKVRLVRRRGRDNVYILKSISKPRVIEAKAVARVLAEKRILDLLEHPFCAHLFQVFSDTDPHGSVHLLLDAYMGGTLAGLLRDIGCLDVRSTRFYSACITSALDHLHHQSIVYRSLHPSTIGIDATGYIKLIDFGYARILQNGSKTFTLCGTPEYLAPELVTSAGHRMPVDMWALGVLTFEMLHGNTPFDDLTPMGVYRKIIAGKVVYPPGELPAVKDLLQRLLVAEPAKRCDSRKVKRALFFQNIIFAKLEKAETSAPPWKPALRSTSDPQYCLPVLPILGEDVELERKDLTGFQKDIGRLDKEFLQL